MADRTMGVMQWMMLPFWEHSIPYTQGVMRSPRGPARRKPHLTPLSSDKVSWHEDSCHSGSMFRSPRCPQVIELPCAERVLEKYKFQVYISELPPPLASNHSPLGWHGRSIRDASEQGWRSPKTEMRDRTRLLSRGFGLVERVPVRGTAPGGGDQGL